MPKYTILLVEDDAQLAGFLAEQLRFDGYDVVVARDGRETLEAVDANWPDLILLDLMLPDAPGEEVAARVKERADLPIIVLSAVWAADSKAEMIQRYAEDFITKPFHYPEVLARIERVLSRTRDRVPAQELVLGDDLTLVLQRRQAVVSGAQVRLSPIETRLLTVLAASLDQPLTTERLLARVWPGADGADPAYVWVTVRRLRQKIERDPDHPRYLHSERGGGYRLGAATGAVDGAHQQDDRPSPKDPCV